MSCAAKLLAYCVVRGSQALAMGVGVRGAPVKMMNVESLTCIYSPIIPPPQFEPDDALRFHAVLSATFQQQAVIPFRFPTLLQNDADLRAHLSEKLAVYSADLQRLADMVQMELRLSVDKASASSATSGTEYLKNKLQISQELQAASQRTRSTLEELVIDWKERPTDQGLRCYALVKRADVGTFCSKLEASHLSGSGAIVLSGPWPTTEFLHG